MSEERLHSLVFKYGRVIIDQAHAYFDDPIEGVDTIYTCRKFLGVPDGAFLYTNTVLQEEIPQDVSYERMHYLLGRYEKTASEFYDEYVANNFLLANEPIKKMSKLTENLLHGIDYKRIKDVRTRNYEYLHRYFAKWNGLNLQETRGHLHILSYYTMDLLYGKNY